MFDELKTNACRFLVTADALTYLYFVINNSPSHSRTEQLLIIAVDNYSKNPVMIEFVGVKKNIEAPNYSVGGRGIL